MYVLEVHTHFYGIQQTFIRVFSCLMLHQELFIVINCSLSPLNCISIVPIHVLPLLAVTSFPIPVTTVSHSHLTHHPIIS